MENHTYENDTSEFEAKESPSNLSPELDESKGDAGILTHSIYSVGYYSSFCTMFPIFLIANLIPKDSAFSKGCTDGARAARDHEEHVFNHIKSATQKVGERVGTACANASSGIMQRVETVQDRIAERQYHRQVATENRK